MAGGRTIACDAEVCALLCEAIRGYAHAAFPPGGSECAQAARAGMLEIAEQLQTEQAASGTITLRGRQKGALRGAVRVYFDELSTLTGELAAQRRELLLGLLNGRAAAGEGP